MTRNCHTVFGIAAFGLAFWITPASAEMIQVADQVAYISQAQPDTNFNGSSFLNAGNIAASSSHKSYIKYNVADMGNASDATFSITFLQTPQSSSPGAVQYDFEVFGLNEGEPGWSESTITWNNAPGNDVSSGSGLIGSAVTSLGGFSITGGTGIGQVGGAALTSFVNADIDGYVSLIVVRLTSSTTAGTNYVHTSPTSFSLLQVVEAPLPGAFSMLVALFVPGMLIGFFRFRAPTSSQLAHSNLS